MKNNEKSADNNAKSRILSNIWHHYRHSDYTKIKSTDYFAGCDSLRHLENKEIP